MTWTNGRRLATISAINDHAALGFTYDSDGLRLTKTVGTEVHKYTWQGSKLIAEQYGDTALEFFYDESGAPYAFSYKADANAAEQIFYYVTDLQGDVMQILDAGGNTVASYTYNAWGKILNLNNSTSANIGDLNPIRYRGYYYDTETGLYYLKSRYYDPEICRFINADGLASTGQGFLGANMFTYCLNNPVLLQDSEGDSPALIWYFLFLNSEFGFIHRMVQADIVKNNPQMLIEVWTNRSDGTLGRADVVDPSTGHVWEVKSQNTVALADAQARSYINGACFGSWDKTITDLGEAGRFANVFYVNCLGRTYLVSYTTPAPGVISYSVNENMQFLPDTVAVYVPKKTQRRQAATYVGTAFVGAAIGIGLTGGGGLNRDIIK